MSTAAGPLQSTARRRRDGAGAARTRPATILLVDDDRVVRRYLDLALGRDGGYVIEGAEHMPAAMDILAGTMVDVVVTDIAMPQADGFSLLRRLRRDRRFRDLPVIFLTSDHRQATRVAALQQGADDYLVKPVDLPELVARIEAVRRRALAARSVRDARRYTLAGDFTGMPLADLLCLLDQGRRTGALAVVTPRAGAELRIANGQPTAATYGTLSGAEAVYALLAESAGRFEFTPGPAGPAERPIAPTSALLMEGARRLDEAGRGGEVGGDSGSTVVASPAVTAAPAALDPAAATGMANAITEPFTLGEIALLDAEDLAAWTAGQQARERFHVLLVAEPDAAIAAFSAAAAPLAADAIRATLASAPLTAALRFDLRHERMLDVVLVDEGRIGDIAPHLHRHPDALAVAPADGDPLALGVSGWAALSRLAELGPGLVLGWGNIALAAELEKLAGGLRCRHLAGALGRPGADLRDLLRTALLPEAR